MLNRLVGNEPGIAATAPIAPGGMAPARDIRFIGVGNAKREPVEERFSLRRKMKNIFMTVVQKASRVDRLEMSARNFFAVILGNRDGLDPMNRVLQDEGFAQPQN